MLQAKETTELEIDSIHKVLNNYEYSTWQPKASVIDATKTTYQEFFSNFMLKNLPCIIQNVSDSWICSQKWVKDNTINYDYLTQTYGELEAPVANCSDITFNSQCKVDMKVKDFMDYMRNSTRNKLLYLKDWHLRRLLPDDMFYTVPTMLQSDWLNEYAKDNKEDDFMFVYIGPCGSWTPLHADVYSSYSWSVNVIGRKKWILLPPGEEKKLQDNLGNLPTMCNPQKNKDLKYFEIIQEKGDVLFVPSGWHHQVVNIMDTISINHNWINGCNIMLVWNALIKALKLVEHEIEEFKDTPEFFSQCQIVLKTFFGMDFDMFFKFLTYIGNKRYKQMENEENPSLLLHENRLGKNHLKFDIINIIDVMESILKNPYIQEKKYVMNDGFSKLKTDLVNVIT